VRPVDTSGSGWRLATRSQQYHVRLMKKLLILLTTAAAGAAFLLFAGSPTSGGAIDTSTLQKAFQSASSVDKTEVQNAISAIKSHDYPGAMASLGKVASSPNLTPEQKSAVQNTASEVKANGLGGAQQAIGGGGDLTNQAGQGVGKAQEQLNKILKP
jgi:hypothetical protein